MSSIHQDTAIYQRPAELLQNLLRFNTTNPPGNENECIRYIDSVLKDAGFETTLLSSTPNRPNLVTRLKGQGSAPPLLLQGHIDVVTTEKQAWRHPPFEGEIADGYIWGRGTLDMKGGVAMMLAALMRAKAEGGDLPGDVIFTALSDEEAGGREGARFLVENHADLFRDVRYALGEFGGFSIHVAGKKFYPIQVLEKQVCWSKARVRGPGGHGSMTLRDGAVAKLGRLLSQLNQQSLPLHITAVPRQMFEIMAQTLPAEQGEQFRLLLDPTQTDTHLDLLGPHRRMIEPTLHNTVNVTVIRGGSKVNVIPGEIEFEMDGRVLPGYTAADFLGELRQIIGDDVEIDVVTSDEGRAEADMGYFDTLAEILHEQDPSCAAIPVLMPVATDGRFFSRLGIQTYGFIPIDLPADFNFLETIHAANERIPVTAMQSGTEAIYQALRRNKA